MSSDLQRLLSPGSIAVVGGGAWCRSVVLQCLAMGYAGRICVVHPVLASLAGVVTVRRVQDLPVVPDAVFIGVNRHATIELVAQLSKMGAGGAVCFASGFAEAEAEAGGGQDLQAALLDAAGAMPVLGPNCYGFINYLDQVSLWPDQHGGMLCKSGVAIVTQSSNIAINLTMQTRGLPVAYVVTTGNQAQQGFSAIGMAVLEDPRVTALGLYIEGIGDVATFEALAARARTLGKPIIALRVGASEQARAGTVSHTASIAGSDAGGRALLRRLGIAQVSSLAALVETLKLCHVVGGLGSNKIASMSCSGGEASLIADAALGHDIVFSPLDADQTAALRTALGPMVALANPLDYHTYIWGDVPAMTQTFVAMMQGDVAIGCVIADFPRKDRCDPSDWACVLEAITQARRISGKPMALVASFPEGLPESIARDLIAQDVVPLNGLTEAIEALAAAAFIGRARVRPVAVLRPLMPREVVRLDEADAKHVLAAKGVPVPRHWRGPAEDAAKGAASLGFPVVVKGEGFVHKTEAGAVVLDLRDSSSVTRAVTTMRCETILVEEMIDRSVAELLVGVVLDPAHGYVLTLAAGGVLTELLKDRVSMLIPAGMAEVDEALDQLRIGPVLRGYRGGAPARRSAILDAIQAVQTYVIDNHGRVSEIEINPLICTADRAVAADAVITLGERDDGQPD